MRILDITNSHVFDATAKKTFKKCRVGSVKELLEITWSVRMIQNDSCYEVYTRVKVDGTVTMYWFMEALDWSTLLDTAPCTLTMGIQDGMAPTIMACQPTPPTYPPQKQGLNNRP